MRHRDRRIVPGIVGRIAGRIVRCGGVIARRDRGIDAGVRGLDRRGDRCGEREEHAGVRRIRGMAHRRPGRSGVDEVEPIHAADLDRALDDTDGWPTRADRQAVDRADRRRGDAAAGQHEPVGPRGAPQPRGHGAPIDGDLDQELEPEQFYAMVGRPDLGEDYASRRTAKIAGYVVGGRAVTAGTVLALSLQKECPIGASEPTFSMCLADNRQSFYTAFGVGYGVGLIGFSVGLWYSFHPHPISENEAKSLADVYNQRLRRELGLPVVARAPLLRDVKLTPFIGRSDTGGLALSSRF